MMAGTWRAVLVGLAGIVLLVTVAFSINRQNEDARFIKAVQKGDVNTVRIMLGKNSELARAEISPKKGGGKTPVLYIAVRKDYDEIVRLLLSHSVSHKSCSQALRYANNREVAKLLIEYGADVNWRDEKLSTPTALHFFAATNNTEMVELLISCGAEVNARCRKGETPLHKAALEGCLSAAKLLISNGADINARSRGNKTPFDCAVFPVWDEDAYRLNQKKIRNCKEVGAYFLECGSSANIFELVWLGDMQRVIGILKDNPSVVNERANGEPLLFAAIRGGNAEIVEYLLTHGAQLKVTGRFKQTPLQLAAYMGYTEIVQILLDNKVDVDERGSWGETALHWAAVRGNTDVAELLLDRGAGVNIQTSGATIDLNIIPNDESEDIIENELRWFRTCEKIENAKKLGIGLQVMGPIKLAFAKGDTPIHAAAYWNHPDIVKMFIAKGADVNRTNRLGETALHYAVVCCYQDIAKMLLDSGANPEAKTNKGMPPIDIAREVKDQKLIKLLSGM